MIVNKLVVPGMTWEVLDRDQATAIYNQKYRNYELYAVNPINYVEWLIESNADLEDFISQPDLLLCKEYNK
jgi:hypothetical protein